jgi:alpha-tubulin suppressor-like RCC1 family protein
MPNQFFFYRDDYQIEVDIEDHFATDYWLFEQFIGDQLWAWGDNTFGAVGDNTNTVSRSTPRQEFTSSTNWDQISASDNVLAVKTNGTLWAWGRDSGGELGDNTSLIDKSTPVQVGTATNWKQISASSSHSTAIKTDGTLWSWGVNTVGQLGDGTVTAKSTPVQVGTATNWKQVTAGSTYTLAIKTDGTLWSWGQNSNGQLGDGTIAVRVIPTQEFTSSTNWKQVEAGSGHTVAIKTDGTLWAWGRNDNGQIGDNTQGTLGANSRSTPRQVGTATNWKQVDAGGGTTAAIKTDGTLWAWGGNSAGQVGDNTNASRSTPTRVGTSNNWKQVSVGLNNIGAIKTNGTLWTWGWNANGQLGDNTLLSRSTPIQEFTSSTNWKKISFGANLSVAVKTGVDINFSNTGYYTTFRLSPGTASPTCSNSNLGADYPPLDFYGSWTGLTNASSDDAFVNVPLPFTWTFNSVGYTNVQQVSNSYITFGTSNFVTFTGLSASNPAVPKLFLGAADHSFQRVSYVSTSNFVRIRHEGTAATSGTVGSPNIVLETTFFNPTLFGGSNYVEVRVGRHAGTAGALATFGIATASAYLASGTMQQYQSYVFAGNSTGTTWTLYQGYYIR